MTDDRPRTELIDPQSGKRQPARSGRHWLRLFGIAVLIALPVAGVIALLTKRPQPTVPADIAQTASNAAPEVAQLIYAATDVAINLQQQFPYSAEAADVMAKTHFRFGSAEQAVSWWMKCLELDPEFKTAYRFIATTALERGDNEEAEIYFRKAIAAEPDSSVLPIQLGEVLMHQGKLDEAIAVLEANRREHPRAMPGLALLGQSYLQVNEYARARETLEKCIELGPDYTNAYYGLYKACSRLGEEQQAETYLAKFKDLKARDEQLHRTGLREADDLPAIRGAAAQIYTEAAQVYISRGDVATGEQLLGEAIALNPTRTEARQVLVWLLARQGRREEAVQQLERIIQADLEDVGVLFSIASLCVQLEQLDKAEQMYRKIIQSAPQQPAGYVSLADLYLKAGRNLDQAKELVRQAIELDPKAEHFALLCMISMKTGDWLGASSAAARAVRLEPENQDYRRLLAATQPRD